MRFRGLLQVPLLPLALPGLLPDSRAGLLLPPGSQRGACSSRARQPTQLAQCFLSSLQATCTVWTTMATRCCRRAALRPLP